MRRISIIIIFLLSSSLVFAAISKDERTTRQQIVKQFKTKTEVMKFQESLNAKLADTPGFIPLKVDGKIGKLTTAAYEKANPQSSKMPSNNEEKPRGGSGKGDALDTMRGTNFCTRINGNRDGDGVDSCGTVYGDCKDQKSFSNRPLSRKETIEACQSCPDCQFVKGSCGTPLYFYKGNKDNAQTNANKNIKAVALTEKKLKAIFGSSSQGAYCEKSINICKNDNPNDCKPFPVRDTGHDREDVIDMTGRVIADLGLSNDSGINTGFIIKRIGDEASKVADAPAKTKTR